MAKRGRNIGRKNKYRDDDIKEAEGNVTGTRAASKQIEDAVSEAAGYGERNPTEEFMGAERPKKTYKEDAADVRGSMGTQKFANGGDVRYNANRGKTY